MVTVRIQDRPTLVCDSLSAFDFVGNTKTCEIEVYHKHQFLGNLVEVLGVSEESLLEYIQNS